MEQLSAKAPVLETSALATSGLMQAVALWTLLPSLPNRRKHLGVVSFEREAAQQPVQPSAGWEDEALVWLLGAPKPEVPAGDDCNK